MDFAHWDRLVYGIEQDECVLFLGPNLPPDTPPGATPVVPAQALAQRLLRKLPPETTLKPGVEDLRRIAQKFINQTGDEADLEIEVKKWHGESKGLPSSVHDDIAALPFRVLVTSSHDGLMEAALKRAGKTPCVAHYDYLGKNIDILPEPSVEKPLLFHLYGHVSVPRSIVLTETQLLDFLVNLISREAPLPDDLNARIAKGRLFLFLGFGLEQWYLRILLHVLKILTPKSRKFAIEHLAERLQDPSGSIVFYQENYKMDIQQASLAEFVRHLRDLCPQSGAPENAETRGPAPAIGRRVFICHAHEDATQARDIRTALSQAGLEPWLDKDSLRGGDRWDDSIETTIAAVDYFVVLNSQALAAKAMGAAYVNKEIRKALEADERRLFANFIVPVRIDDEPLLVPLRKFHSVDLRRDGARAIVRAIKRQVAAA